MHLPGHHGSVLCRVEEAFHRDLFSIGFAFWALEYHPGNTAAFGHRGGDGCGADLKLELASLPADEVYLLGDFMMRGPQYTMRILGHLNGIKFLVRGNYDGFVDRVYFDRPLFRWVKDYHRLFCQRTQFIFFHYPIADWDQAHHGSIHLHGHQHNPPGYNLKNTAHDLRRYDVGVDANGMAPVCSDRIIFLDVLRGPPCERRCYDGLFQDHLW